jgi:hypothetical protein
MNNTLKVIIAVAAALAVGLVVGLVLGMSGKRDAEAKLAAATRRATEAEQALETESKECSSRVTALTTSRKVLQVKESLLRALVEICANNYGLTSQHLGQARTRLRSAQKKMDKAAAAKAQQIFEEIGNAQTLAMRLDPMAKVSVEKVLAKVSRLPGAR